jgi:hypothetical protein
VLTCCVNAGACAAAVWYASDIARSGFFSWLAADSTSITVQHAALFTDALVLATGVGAVVLLNKSYILGPAILLYVQFRGSGSTLFSKRVYHILD